MKGINYVTDDKNKKVAVQIDLEKYGELWEEFMDIIDSIAVKDEEAISLTDLKTELKASGKL